MVHTRAKSDKDQNAQRRETREGADKKIGFEGETGETAVGARGRG